MAKNKEKTLVQQTKSLKRLSRLCFAGEFVSVATPFIAIGLVNYEKYFIQYNGTKISIGFGLAMAIMGLAIWLIGKKEIANSMITFFIGWGAATGVLFLIEELLSDLCYIMLFGWLGVAGALGLDIGKKNLLAKSNDLLAAINQAEKELAVEQYKTEKAVEEASKKFTVKIKK